MKNKEQIQVRIKNLEKNNEFVTDKKGHLMNELRLRELREIREMSFSELRNRWDVLKKARTGEADAKIAQIKWILDLHSE